MDRKVNFRNLFGCLFKAIRRKSFHPSEARPEVTAGTAGYFEPVYRPTHLNILGEKIHGIDRCHQEED